MKNRWLPLIGVELLVGLVLFAGYQAWIQPGAPRNAVKESASAEVMQAPSPTTPPAPAPAAAAPIGQAGRPSPTAAPVSPPPVVPQPQPTPQPTKKSAVAKKATLVASPDELLRQAQSALNAKDWSGALRALDQLQAATKAANPDLGYLRGMALENLGQPGAAIDAYRKCTSGPYAAIAANHVKMLAGKLR